MITDNEENINGQNQFRCTTGLRAALQPKQSRVEGPWNNGMTLLEACEARILLTKEDAVV